MEAHGVNIAVQSAQPSIWMQILGSLLPLILMAAPVDLRHAPDAGRRARGDGLRQVQGQAA